MDRDNLFLKSGLMWVDIVLIFLWTKTHSNAKILLSYLRVSVTNDLRNAKNHIYFITRKFCAKWIKRLNENEFQWHIILSANATLNINIMSFVLLFTISSYKLPSKIISIYKCPFVEVDEPVMNFVSGKMLWHTVSHK